MSFSEQAVLRLEELLEDRVVERLRAEQPDRERELARDLARLALLHHRRDRRLARHAHERDALVFLREVHVGERVGGVRVAAAGRRDHVGTGARDAGDRLPRGAVALEVRHERGVDDVVLERVHEHGRHQPAVLADLVQLGVGGAGEAHVLEHAAQLADLAGPAEEELVDLGLPRPEAGAGPGARGAGLLAVAAVARAAEVLDLERLVDAVRVVVGEHVVRAGDHAAGAARAQPRRDDLVVEVLPRERPAFLGCGARSTAVIRPPRRVAGVYRSGGHPGPSVIPYRGREPRSDHARVRRQEGRGAAAPPPHRRPGARASSA